MILPVAPSFHLNGKNALVAGASSGIGMAAGVALAKAGASVTLVARRQAPLNEIVDSLRAEGATATATVLDITDLQATDSFLAASQPFDILVNCAGLARHAPAVDTNPDDFDAVLDINLRAAYFLSRGVARRLISLNRPGSLINISSQMGHVGGPDRTIYCASKHALEGMTKAMALEWGKHGIRINTISPTFIRTPLTEASFADPKRRAWIESNIVLGRVGTVEDIMGPVVFLASDSAALITGTSLVVDGGWTAH